MLPRDGDPSPAWLEQRDTPPDPSAVSASIERIRSSVHRWLDRIDELAAVAVEAALSAEQKRAALQAELHRRQREWDAQLEALEHDRRQLAEAWERLEREQITAMSMGRPADAPDRGQRPAPSPTPAPTPAASQPSSYYRHTAELDDSVDRAIIRQFEALRKDVRRAAESRGVSPT